MSDSPEPRRDALSAVQSGFPKSQDDFESDPRVSFSKLDDKYLLEDDDGSEWEWDDKALRWIPSVDQDLIRKQQEAYAVEGVDEHEQVKPPSKKRKSEDEPKGASKKAKQPPKKNTAVYATSIPFDADASEVHRVFSRYGVVAEEIESGEPRIKLYTDDAGNFKGDALVVYFRPESVSLAIQMLDETDFRLGERGPSGKMRVAEADASYKRHQDPKAAREAEEQKHNGSAKRFKSKTVDQKKIIQRTQKLNAKLADWSDTDDDPSALTQTSSRHDKVVILTHMFTPAELAADPAALLDIKEDVRDECAKLGPVTNVVLFDREPDGVMSVRFGSAVAARDAVRAMHGRHFGGRTVEARIADGKERFRKSKDRAGGAGDDDDEEDEEKRLDEFGKWLESGGGGDGGGAADGAAAAAA